MKTTDNILKNKINSYLEKEYKYLDYLLVGRSAIDLAIKEIKNNSNLRKAYLPTYICDVMVQPFIDNNIQIDFYDVFYNKKEFTIDTNKFKNDDNYIILYCDYFINNEKLYNEVADSISKNAILIHDVTHTLFSKDYIDTRDDFLVSSIRKWFVTPEGGLLISKKPISIALDSGNSNYLNLKEAAQVAKKEYYQDPSLEKKIIYRNYSNQAENELCNNYALKKMSEKTKNTIIDIDFNKFFDDKKQKFIILKELLKEYEILCGANENNSVFTIPIINLENRKKTLEEFRNNLIRCDTMWEYGNSKIMSTFVNKSICIDISDNTIKRLTKGR